MSANKQLQKVMGGAFNLTKATRSAAAASAARASKFSHSRLFFFRQRLDPEVVEQTQSNSYY